MTRMVATLWWRGADDAGQDLLEYGLLAALIAIVAIVGVTAVGETISTVFWDGIAEFVEQHL